MYTFYPGTSNNDCVMMSSSHVIFQPCLIQTIGPSTNFVCKLVRAGLSEPAAQEALIAGSNV